jgi:hypothetical protein
MFFLRPSQFGPETLVNTATTTLKGWAQTDGTGAHATVQIAQLNAGMAMSGSDFIFV